jgi:hypothetical protein
MAPLLASSLPGVTLGALMALPGLPNAVPAFVHDHIRDADDLHLLVAMASDDQRWWDEKVVSGELFMDGSRSRNALEHLAGCNLLEIRVTGAVRYQFRPGTEALRAAALATVAAHRHNPAAVLHLIRQSRARRGVRAFAEAFRVRPRDDR